MADGEDALVRIAALGEVRRRGHGGEGAMRAEQHVLRGVFGHQRLTVAGQQDRNGVRLEQGARGELCTNAEEALSPDTGGGEVNVLKDVVERDVGVVSGGAGDGGRGETSEGGERPVRRGEAGEDEIEPDDIRFDFANGVQQAQRVLNAAELPATDDVEAGEFRLAADVKRSSIGVGCDVSCSYGTVTP